MSKKQFFWTLQLGGWFSYYLFHTLLYTPYVIYTLKDWSLYTLTFIIGVFITIGLRQVYRYAYKKIEKLIWIPITVIVGSALATAIWYFSDVYVSHLFWENGQMELRSRLQPMYMLNYNYLYFIVLTAWSGLYFGIKSALNWQIEKKENLEAQMMAHQAQMKMLRYQLNPHFLFNSLNSIQVLVDENKESAKEMISELSEFLRYSLLHKETTFVSLSKELEAIQHYFSIEKKRFEEKLDIKYEVDDDVKNVQVLSFILHPLIENAVKYGMRTSPMPLRIKLTAKKSDYGLCIEICNSGTWIEHQKENHRGTGTGLCNVKERLENAYNKDHHFDIIKENNHTCIRIEIKDTYLLPS